MWPIFPRGYLLSSKHARSSCKARLRAFKRKNEISHDLAVLGDKVPLEGGGLPQTHS